MCRRFWGGWKSDRNGASLHSTEAKPGPTNHGAIVAGAPQEVEVSTHQSSLSGMTGKQRRIRSRDRFLQGCRTRTLLREQDSDAPRKRVQGGTQHYLMNRTVSGDLNTGGRGIGCYRDVASGRSFGSRVRMPYGKGTRMYPALIHERSDIRRRKHRSVRQEQRQDQGTSTLRSGLSRMIGNYRRIKPRDRLLQGCRLRTLPREQGGKPYGNGYRDVPGKFLPALPTKRVAVQHPLSKSHFSFPRSESVSRFSFLVPMLCVGMQSGALLRPESVTTPAQHKDAPRERHPMHSHAERGNERPSK